MAREEQDREDLMREATALVERMELSIDGQPVVVGFRRNGAASLFYGADPVYQFNTNNELRRAFVAGELIKAEKGILVALQRQRSEQQTMLVRRELPPSQSADFLENLRSRLGMLREALEGGNFEIVASIPAGPLLTERVREWLAGLKDPIRVAASPRIV